MAAGAFRAAAWLPALLLPAIALLFEYGGIDRAVVDAFYDAGRTRFTFADAWWSNGLLHEGGRAFIKILGVGALLFALLGLRLRPLRAGRRAAFYLALCIGLGAGLVNTGKAVTNVDCPWSLQRYGGDRPYVHVFADRPDDLPRGRCFPAGHAAGGYSLIGLWFVALGLGWRRPHLWLLPGIGVGLAFGLAQWARGAHFPSHDLWAAAVCWLVALVLYRHVFAGRLTPAD